MQACAQVLGRQMLTGQVTLLVDWVQAVMVAWGELMVKRGPYSMGSAAQGLQLVNDPMLSSSSQSSLTREILSDTQQSIQQIVADLNQPAITVRLKNV